MKIGYLLQQGFDLGPGAANGPANHVSLLVENLERLGHQVKIVMMLGGSVLLGEFRQDKACIGWKPSGAPLEPTLGERAVRRVQRHVGLPYLNLFESLRFARACRAECRDVDVFLERLSWTGYGGSWAARDLGKPHSIEYNGDPLHDLDAKGIAPSGLQRWVSNLLMRRTFNQATLMVASGEGWRQQLISRWKVPGQKVITVHNGTNLLGLLPRTDLRCFHETVEVDTPPRFVYLGGFQPWQGVETLLKVFVLVLQQLPRASLMLIGDGPGLDRAKNLAATLGLDGSIRFMGAMPPQTYAPLLARADIGLSPYCGWPEFEGLKIFDYKAAGLAIIASGREGQPESVTSGPVGKIVPPCDEKELAKAMVELGADVGMRRALGCRARLEAEARHGWEHTAAAIEAVLQDIVLGDKCGRT